MTKIALLANVLETLLTIRHQISVSAMMDTVTICLQAPVWNALKLNARFALITTQFVKCVKTDTSLMRAHFVLRALTDA